MTAHELPFPVRVLMNEHRLIEKVLDCLESMRNRCRNDRALDAESARDAIDFFRNFADKCHHGKEEVHLFAMLEDKGMPLDQGPTAQMRHEHELGRASVKAMIDAIDDAAAGDATALDTFATSASAFLDLLRDHIVKEDECLFPITENALDESELEILADRFRATEKKDFGPEFRQTYVERARSLCERCGVEWTAGLESPAT